jgi:RNA 2',3'-cyclic 3'-phosphodiesterase
MRLFVAVELSITAVTVLAQTAGALRLRIEQRAPAARVTWVPADRMHITVRFIGEVDEGRGDAIARALREDLRVPPFTLLFGDVGAFPPRGRPRVFWVGLSQGDAEMRALEREVTARLAFCDVPRDARAFSPHLTLGRVREASSLETRDALAGLAAPPGTSSPVDAITLFQSRLSPKGPIYVPLLRTPLVGPTQAR